MCERETKALTLAFRTFGKRNTQRFRILDDLTLACAACKTPEARRDLNEMTRRYFLELQLEQNSLNKQLDKIMREAAKAGGKKDKKKKDAVIQALETAAVIAIKKEVSFKLSSNSKLKLKYRGLKKSPFVTFELMF